MNGSHALRSRALRLFGALGIVALLATTALAQDYEATITTATGDAYESPPTNATTLSALTGQDDARTNVTLPFSFPYYGSAYTTTSVCTNGFIQFGGGTAANYSNLTLPQSGSLDGIVCPFWDDLYLRSTGTVKTWTSGSAPNRRFIISWEAVPHISNSSSRHTFQIKLFETSGDIVFAYTNTSSYELRYGHTVGIDEPNGSRYVYPPGRSGSGNTTAPSNYRFEPEVTTFSGRVLIEEIVTDANGHGASTGSTVPGAGLLIEIRTGGVTAGSGYTDENGDFEAEGIALDSRNSGSLHLVSGSQAALVTPSSSNSDPATMSAPFSVVIDDSISFGGDNDVGTFTLDDDNDEDGAARGPIQIAMVMDRIRALVTSATGAEIPRVDVFWSDTSAAPSRFASSTDTVPASIRVGGAAANNPDTFDAAVIARLYMRAVVDVLTGQTTSDYEEDLDIRQSNTLAAFIDGLGLYAYARTTGNGVAWDGTGPTTATSLDLEDPDLSRNPGPGVGGWVGAAFYDLIDPANEDHDDVDGTLGSAADRPLVALAGIDGAASGVSFVNAWVAEGFDAEGLVRDFIHHGLLPDDANEPNDSMADARLLGTAGVRAAGLTLNRYNEDWFAVDVAEFASVFFVEVAFNRFETAAQVGLQVYSQGGSLLATGTPDGQNGPIVALLQNVNAGRLFVRVEHQSGSLINSYDLQAYAQMSVALSSAPAWTVGRRIQEPLDLRGGIPPYTVSAKDQSGAPFTAIQFLPSQAAPFDMVWTPQDVGNVLIQVSVTDSGVPAHTRNVSLNFTVNDVLSFSAPELTGVALDKTADVNLGRRGGTDPIALSNVVGDLPGGLSIDPDFHIRGTASEPGGGAFGFEATDVAGSEAEVDSFLVVCVPIQTKNQPVPLAGGQSAAGFYFDALTGSEIAMKLKTAKKMAKRELNFLVIGPDGNVVRGGTAKVKSGTIKLKGLPIPTTGRYFMAFESDDGGPATELQGTLKIKLPGKSTDTIEGMELESLYKVEFGALEGATLQLKGKTTEGMEIRVRFIIRPDGSVIPFDKINVENNTKKGKVKITTEPLTQSGTYQMYLEPLKTDLADFKFKTKIKQPKGGEFELDD